MSDQWRGRCDDLNAEINSLRTANAKLLAACEAAEDLIVNLSTGGLPELWAPEITETLNTLESAVALAKGERGET